MSKAKKDKVIDTIDTSKQIETIEQSEAGVKQTGLIEAKQSEAKQAEKKQAANSDDNSEKNPLKPYQFKAGQSGNPSGRPKLDDEVKQMLRAAAPKAVAMLVNYIDDDKIRPDQRIRCAEVVLDRVYGKAVQPLDSDICASVTINLSSETDDLSV